MIRAFPVSLRLLVCTLALTALSAPAAADIRTTRHNLGLAPHAGDASVCVFCHTPSGFSDADAKGGATPLWQRRGDPAAFATYEGVADGAPEGRSRPGVGSVVCLSCHDASQAQDIGGPATRDHPVGVPYRGALAGTTRSDAFADPTLARRGARSRATADFRPAMRAILDGVSVWWVPARFGGPARGSLDLPLSSRSGPDGVDTAMIECTTCHNPHAATRAFLRIPGEERSALCLNCHVM